MGVPSFLKCIEETRVKSNKLYDDWLETRLGPDNRRRDRLLILRSWGLTEQQAEATLCQIEEAANT